MHSRPLSRLLLAALLSTAAVGVQLARPSRGQTSDEPATVQPFGTLGGAGFIANASSTESVIQSGSDDALATGPYAVANLDYDFGDTFFNTQNPLPGMAPDEPLTAMSDESSCELKGRVSYPAGLPGGPFPVILFMHGQHMTAHEGGRPKLAWPPTGNQVEIPNYRGYDYVMDHLASRGFVCISISANGVNSSIPFEGAKRDFGIPARSALIDAHMNLIEAANTTDTMEFGNQFVGKLNLRKLALVGHSRGGEGVVQWYLSHGLDRPGVEVAGLVPLCATNNGKLRPVQVPLGVILGYADGDVADQAGIQYYDRTRFSANLPDFAPKHVFNIQGANHNFFNTVWSPNSRQPASYDDWLIDVWRGTGNFLDNRAEDEDLGQQAGSQKLDEEGQRRILKAYMTAFMETYLEGTTRWSLAINGGGYFTSFGRDRVAVSYQPGATQTGRLDVNRLLGDSSLQSNIVGGKVTGSGFWQYDLAGGSARRPHIWGHPNPHAQIAYEPHTTSARFISNDILQGTSLLVASWNSSGATWVNALPTTLKDVRRFQALQFRATVDWINKDNPVNQPVDFEVGLRDTNGVIVYQKVSTWSNALNYPHGSRDNDIVPKWVTSTVRIPLYSLIGPNLASVKEIEFRFSERSRGSVVIGELQFVDPQTPLGGLIDVPKSLDFKKVPIYSNTSPYGKTKTFKLKNTSRTDSMAFRLINPPKTAFTLLYGTQPRPELMGTLSPGQSIEFGVRYLPMKLGKDSSAIIVLSSAHHGLLLKLKGRGGKPPRR